MPRGERRLATLFFEINARTKGLQQDITRAERDLGRFSAFIRKHPVAAAASLSAALAGVAYQAIQMAAKVDASVRRVAASLPEATGRITDLKKAIADLSKESGRDRLELAEGLNEAARGGVAGVDDLIGRLQTATKVADATGESLSTVLGGLDQALDLFGIRGEAAERVLAKLFVTAQGRTNLTDLFTVLQAAAPTVERTGASFDTLTGAIVALLDKGYKGKKLLAELDALSFEQLEALAVTVRRGSDGLEELDAAAVQARNALPSLGAQLKEALLAPLYDLGEFLLPPAIAGLQALKAALDQLSDVPIERIGNLLRLLTPGGTNAIGQDLGRKLRQALRGERPRPEPEQTGLQSIGGPVEAPRTGTRALTEQELKELRDARNRLEGILVGFTETLVDDTQLELRRLEAAFAELPKAAQREVQALFNQVVAAFQAKIEEIRRTELEQRIEKTIGEIRPRVVGGGRAPTPLQVQQPDFAAQQRALQREIEEADRAYRAEKAASDKRRAEEERLRLLERLRAIDQAVSGALQLADAFGVVNKNARQALEAIAQIGTSIAGAFGPDGTFKLDLSGFLGIAGGITSLIGSLFQEDPQAQRRREIIEQNTDAIRELARTIGDLGVLSDVAGSTITGVEAAIRGALAARGGSVGGIVGAGGLEAELARLGLTMKDLRQVAEGLGVSFLGAVPSAAELEQLLRAIGEAEITRFSETFGGQLEAFQDEIELFDITDPIEQMKRLQELFLRFNPGKLAEFLAGDTTGSLGQQFSRFDLSTAEGRAAAEEFIKAAFLRLREGTLTRDDLGDLSLDQFREFLTSFERLIDQANQQAEDGADGKSTSFQFENRITEDTGRFLGGLLQSLYAVQREGTDYLREIRDTIVGRSPVEPPSGAALRAAGIGFEGRGEITIGTIQLTVEVTGAAATPEVAERLGGLVGRGASHALLDELARALRKRAVFTGSQRLRT